MFIFLGLFTDTFKVVTVNGVPTTSRLASVSIALLFGLSTEKHRLEQLVEQMPDYFYKILPYTYVLGISNVWIKKFEHIAIRPPEWYSGDTVFDHDSFGRFINSAIRSATAAMASNTSDTGSGSSGGGSSGRGSGGGGSSW